MKIRFTILLLAAVLLCGCAGPNATKKLSVTAKNTIEATKQTLKPECQTKETMALLDNLNSTVEGMLITCEQQVEVLDVKLSNRNLIILFEGIALALIAGLYLKKIL